MPGEAHLSSTTAMRPRADRASAGSRRGQGRGSVLARIDVAVQLVGAQVERGHEVPDSVVRLYRADAALHPLTVPFSLDGPPDVRDDVPVFNSVATRTGSPARPKRPTFESRWFKHATIPVSSWAAPLRWRPLLPAAGSSGRRNLCVCVCAPLRGTAELHPVAQRTSEAELEMASVPRVMSQPLA